MFYMSKETGEDGVDDAYTAKREALRVMLEKKRSDLNDRYQESLDPYEDNEGDLLGVDEDGNMTLKKGIEIKEKPSDTRAKNAEILRDMYWTEKEEEVKVEKPVKPTKQEMIDAHNTGHVSYDPSALAKEKEKEKKGKKRKGKGPMSIMLRGAADVLKQADESFSEDFKAYNVKLKEKYPHLRVNYKTATTKNDMQYIYYETVMQHKETTGGNTRYRRVKVPEGMETPPFEFEGYVFHKISRADVVFMSVATYTELREHFKGCEAYEVVPKEG